MAFILLISHICLIHLYFSLVAATMVAPAAATTVATIKMTMTKPHICLIQLYFSLVVATVVTTAVAPAAATVVAALKMTMTNHFLSENREIK